MSALHAWPDDASADHGAAVGYRQRKDRRINNPTLAIQIRGKLYQTLNWSLGGMLIGGYEGALVAGATFDIDALGPAGKRLWPVMVRGRVVRTGGETGMEMAAQFLTISAPAFEILEGVLLRRPKFRGAA